MTVLVTGATGLLGSNLVRALQARGTSVRAVVRDPDRAAELLPGAELVAGDLDDVAAWLPALDGCDTVFHLAAYFREYYAGRTADEVLEHRNVTAVRLLLEAAARQGVGFVVHTSSSGVLGRADGAAATEADAPGALVDSNGYFASKWRSEAVVADVVARTGLAVAVVRPGWMFGPGDAAPTSAGQIVLDLARGALPGAPYGSVDVIDARDVAHAMVTAADRRLTGTWNVTGVHRSTAEVFETIADELGVARPRRLPRTATAMASLLGRVTLGLTGRPWPAHPDAFSSIGGGVRGDSSRAAAELDVTTRPLETTIRDTVSWFRAAGRLPGDTGRPMGTSSPARS